MTLYRILSLILHIYLYISQAIQNILTTKYARFMVCGVNTSMCCIAYTLANINFFFRLTLKFGDLNVLYHYNVCIFVCVCALSLNWKAIDHKSAQFCKGRVAIAFLNKNHIHIYT